MVPPARHLALGAHGENAAAAHIQKLGWRILERNWRPSGMDRGLELDIVARNREGLVFVEVKTRSTPQAVGKSGPMTGAIPVEAAFTAQKRARLARAANHYLAAVEGWGLPCRVDLICVRKQPDGSLQLEHHENVIALGDVMDSGHTAWQPW